MQFKRQNESLPWYWALSLVALAAVLAVSTQSLWRRPGWSIYDGLQKLTARTAAPGVAMILVDQDSLNAMEKHEGFVFPWPRQLYGAVAQVARAAGAKGVAFDLLFTEASSHGVEDHQELSRLLDLSGLPIFFPAPSKLGTVKAPAADITAKMHLGGVHSPNEKDGVYRRVPYFVDGQDGPVLSLSEIIARTIFPDQLTDSGSKKGTENWLHFYRSDAIPYIAIYNLILAYRDWEEGRPLSDSVLALKDRVWIVGYSAPGLHDLKPIPTDAQAPGMVVHATALANRIEGAGLRAAAPSTLAVTTAVLGAALIYGAGFFTTPIPVMVFSGALVLFSSLVLSWLFWLAGQWLNPLCVFTGGAGVAATYLTWKFQKQWKDRLRFAKSVEYSMSPQMVELIRRGEVQVVRYGEEREITILFADLAGFTGLSEKLGPAKLVDILNRYLDGVVELIVDHQGYVDKFIGDAVMAFWGAPVRQEQHAPLGLKAAFDFAHVVDTLNRELRAEYGDGLQLETRVGLHTGKVIVGNIGAKSRHNYTAIGDAVNLASRLEGLGKMYNCHLLISEDCVNAVIRADFPGLVEIDWVRVKGRATPARIYTVVGPEYYPARDAYHGALASYYRGAWAQALNEFTSVRDFPPSVVMISRCQQALATGSLSQWQEGVWLHDSK